MPINGAREVPDGPYKSLDIRHKTVKWPTSHTENIAVSNVLGSSADVLTSQQKSPAPGMHRQH